MSATDTDKDPRIVAAISHWAPRFVANGVPLTDFQEVTERLTDWDDWCDAWMARGAVHEDLGHKSLSDDHTLSAGEHFSTAAVCYHFGKFLFVHDVETMAKAHRKAVECRTMALPFLKPASERVEIPFHHDGGRYQFYGNLRKPEGIDDPPVVIMCMGLDSAKEEMETNERVFLDRGMATLAFDGPGQGEAEYDLGILPEYEHAVTAVVNFVERRSDLDGSRIGLWGVSLGGYYAPRAVAFEKRIKACIALSGPYDWHGIWDDLPGLTREAFIVRSKQETPEAAKEFARRVSLKDVAENIECPLYLVSGKLDRVIPYKDQERLAGEVSGPCALHIIEDGTHNANNRAYKYRTQSADWMAERLGAETV